MANEKRLIYAEDAKEALLGWDTDPTDEDIEYTIDKLPTAEAVEMVYGRWEDGRCSNCQEEALSTSWDEPIYDYDWEENLRYSHTETHTEYHLTNYCPNCGAKMDGDGNG